MLAPVPVSVIRVELLVRLDRPQGSDQSLRSAFVDRSEAGLNLVGLTFGGVAFGSLTNLILCRSARGPTRLSLMYLASTSGCRFASTCLPGTFLSRGGGLGWRGTALTY